MPVTEELARRHCIPIIYTRGTHYEVGFDVGRTFGHLIHSFLKEASNLNEEFVPAYETPQGRQAYEDTLANVKENFPQYVRELQGTADGAKVPFHLLFLLHMDVITKYASGVIPKCDPVGCSSICVNNENAEILGHTEDALTSVLNHFYCVSAHIITDQPQGKWGVKEERFTSLCYAGHLPGYTMSNNHHGLIFSINTLSARDLRPGKTPRHFITRALLAAENFEQAQKIIRDNGSGAADGCSFNMSFLNQEGSRLFHNVEMGPCDQNNESQLNVLTISSGEHIIHTNKYLRLPIPQVSGLIIDSSEARLGVLGEFPPPETREDVIQMLGDESHKYYKVFTDGYVKTVAMGLFDLKARTWSLYADNPQRNEPLIVLPLLERQ